MRMVTHFRGETGLVLIQLGVFKVKLFLEIFGDMNKSKHGIW